MSANLTMIAPPVVYGQRRGELAARLSRPVLLFAGYAPARNYATNPHPFRAGSSYLYYGGPPLEGAALLIEPQSNGAEGCTLFRIPPAADDALWIGEGPDDVSIARAAGLAEKSLADPDQLKTHLGNREAAYIAPPCPQAREQIARLGLQPANESELGAVIDMRLIKDEYELAAMRYVADVTVEAHRAAMSATKPGRREADAAAAFHAVLVARECVPSFTPIVTVRGEVLHLHGHPNIMEQGALLLVDGGAETRNGYSCDVTRTFPVSGRWTDIQRQLYDGVLRAMREAIHACTPGRRYRDIHDLSARVICEVLVQADLLKGDPNDLFDRRAHTLFFPHGVGHLIGMEAHDMEDFGDLAGYASGRRRRSAFGDKYLRLDRDLEAGMCVTIEPGIYLVPAIWQSRKLTAPFEDLVNHAKVSALLKNNFGGIRIEETVHVSKGKPEILSRALPSDADEAAGCVGSNQWSAGQ